MHTFFYSLLLLANLPFISFALLKSQDGPLVKNPQPDVVYLIQAPRSAFTISQAPLNIKVEAFLRAFNVEHVSVSSMVFLGSSTDGSVPYAELNGEKLMAPDRTQGGNQSEGSDAIIQRVAERFNLTWPTGKKSKKNGTTTEEERLRQQIDYDLFNTVVMYTRSSTYEVLANGTLQRTPVDFRVSTMQLDGTHGLKSANGRPMKMGLEFMIQDASIREDMFALLVDLAQPAQKTLLGVVLTRQLVHQYYDAVQNGSEQAKQEFLTVGGWNTTSTNWTMVDNGMRQMCTVFLYNRLALAEGGALDNAKKYVNLNTLDGKPVSAYNDAEITQKVQQIYGKIAAQLAKQRKPNNCLPNLCAEKRRLYLFGTQRTPADCSLFGSLVVFFGVPLTVPAMEEYARAVQNNTKHPHHILVEFFEQMKTELKMGNDVWKKLISRPWPLNWESEATFKFEVEMRDVVWEATKRAFAKGATSKLQIGNEH